MISGVHTMFYSSDAEGLREFLRDKLGFKATDVGDGWLIFDLPEAESELVTGYMTEYSGMRYSFFMLAEYGNMLAVGMVATTLYHGGWQTPVSVLEFIPGVVWFFSKALFIVFVQIWVRWTVPRLRVDQLMYICWKVMTPFALACIIGVGLYQILSN